MNAKLRNSAQYFIPLLTGSVMLLISWQRWADIIVDFGREVYLPWQINKGAVLYRDLEYFYGALSPYVNALLFRVFGTQIMVIAAFNIVVVIALASLIYHIFRKTTDTITATATATTFLAVFAFAGVGNYNFVCPYSHGLTHGLFLSFLSISIFMKYVENKKNRYLFMLGVLLGLVFFTKPEVFFAIFIAMFLGIALMLFIDARGGNGAFKKASLFSLGFFIPLAGFTLYFTRHMTFDNAIRSLFVPYAALVKIQPASNIFYLRIMGTDKAVMNILKMLLVSGCYLIVMLLLRLIGSRVRYIREKKSLFADRRALFYSVLFVALCFIICSSWDQIFRGLPVALLMLIGYLCLSLVRSRGDYSKVGRLLPLFVLANFAFFLLCKMILNVRVFHYGFALTMPAVLLLVAIAVYQIPAFLEKKYVGAFSVRFFGLILVGMVLLIHMIASWRIDSAKTYRVGSGLDAIFDFDKTISTRGVYVNLALDTIEKIMKKDENFFVFPEGVMLNYLARRDNPAPYLVISFAELDVFGENAILRTFTKKMPDYIIIVDRDMSEFGYSRSYKPFAPGITSWIEKNYIPVYTVGSEPLTGRGFGITIAKRAVGQIGG